MKFLALTLLAAYTIISFTGCKEDSNVSPEDPNVQNPQSPALVAPTNGSIVRTTTPDLDWNDYSNAVSYRVMVSLDANINGTIILDTTVNSSSVKVPDGKLGSAIFIYWRVIANLQGGGTSNWSAIWKFKVVYDPPQPPILVSPANGSNNVPFMPLFDWNDAATAEYYRIQVSRNSAFTQILIDTNQVVASSYQTQPGFLITGTQYFWRVNASNSQGFSTSDWSTPFNFTTVEGPLPSSVSGRVTFVDTSFVQFPNYYIVGAYDSWPPSGGGPVSQDSVAVQQQGGTFFADYTLMNLANTSYVITLNAVYTQLSDNVILGIYGCDTVHIQYSGCPLSPTQVTLQNYNGVININYLSWADSSKRIY